ncbi:putative Glycosyltransferase RgtA/B/C/D-like domain-containing protein [uncultured Gammaproteobacteria bacterium]
MRWLPISIFVGLTALLVFYRATVLSGFDAVLGDLGDARFNLVILEHWWLVAQGREAWLNPGFFHPAPEVLGYSDALALLAPPYVLARWVGAAPLHALQVTVITATALGYAGMAALLRRGLGVALVPALALAVAFSCGSMVAQSLGAGHVQMMAIMALPWLAWLLLIWTHRRNDARSWGRTLAGCGAVLLVAGLLLTSFYVGWFTGFYLLVLGGVVLAREIIRRGVRPVAVAVRDWLLASRGHLAAVAGCFALAVTPFLRLYLPVLKQSGGRPWAEVARTLPLPADLINPQGNALWAPVVESLVPWLVGRKDELGKGLTWCLLAVFLVTTLWSLCAVRRKNGPDYGLGKAPIMADPRELILGLGLAVAICWLLIVRLGDDTTLWYGIYRGLPGGLGVRSVFRFNLVLALPITMVTAVGLNALWQRTTCWPQLGVALLCLLVAVEQVNLTPKTLSRGRDFARLEAVPAPPASCRVVALLPDEPADARFHRWSRQLDVVLVAQALGLPTVNGYSGNAPSGWALFDPAAGASYREALARWADDHQLWSGLCGLDVDRGHWHILSHASRATPAALPIAAPSGEILAPE